MRLTVTGTGHPGATHAACVAEPGRPFHGAGPPEPIASDSARKAFPLPGYALSAEDAPGGAEPVPRPAEWPRFRAIGPGRAATPVARPRIVDGRGVLDADRRTAAGRRYRAPGRPAPAGEGE